MRVSWINLAVAFGALCGCGSVSGSTHDGKLVNKHRHIDAALAARDDANSTVSLAKRTFENARFSTFTPGPSACGGYNNANQPIVALTQLQWDGGANCFKYVEMTWKGKTIKAQIVDECMECPYGGLDLSTSLFVEFAGSVDPGYLWGSWDYVGAESSPSPKPKPSPSKTTAQEDTKPTSKSSASHAPSSSSSMASSSSSAPASASSASGSQTSASSDASATPTPAQAQAQTQAPTGVLAEGTIAFLQIAALGAAAVGSH